MTVQQMKDLTLRIPYEAFNTKNPNVIDDVVSPDFVDHSSIPGLPGGREGLKQTLTMLTSAFPDLNYRVEKEICEGDLIVHYNTARGTHKGDFMGIAPTKKQVTWTEMHIARFENDRIVEHWAVIDRLSLLQQLGVVSAELGEPHEA